MKKLDAISACTALYPRSYVMASAPWGNETGFIMSIGDLETDATLASSTGASWEECVEQLQAQARNDAAASFELTP